MSEATEKPMLHLLISGKYYTVERIRFDGERAAIGWKLTHFADKMSHGPYCVIRQPSGRLTCECADFILVKQKTGEPCKHIKALKEVGLL